MNTMTASQPFLWDMASYQAPADDVGFDISKRLAAIPDGATIRGFAIYLTAQAMGPDIFDHVVREWKIVPFKDYPERLVLDMAIDIKRFYNDSVTEALRETGRHGYPAFCKSIVGRSISSALGADPKNHLQMIHVGYQAVWPSARIEVQLAETTQALVTFSGRYCCPDIFDIGLMEGVLASCGCSGRVGVQLHSWHAGRLLISW